MTEGQKAFCPYPGLRPFEAEESSLFFGRENHIVGMLEILQREQFLAVVGSSGCGKSSLVRAGLLPALQKGLIGGKASGWHFIIAKPGSDPFGNLARAIVETSRLEQPSGANGEESFADDVKFCKDELKRGPSGILDAVEDFLPGKDAHILVLVDQFEEIFRFTSRDVSAELDEPEFSLKELNQANAFVNLLISTAVKKNANVYVALTMRSDFVGNCDAFRDLPKFINRTQYLPPRMTRDELQEAIERPLERVHLNGFPGNHQIDPNVITKLLDAIGDRQDQLPLIQHALMRMWLNAKDISADNHVNISLDVMMECCDDEGKKVAGALDKHADEIFNTKLDAKQKKIAERLFCCLGERGPKGQLTRRIATIDEVARVAEVDPEEVIAVVNFFREPRVNFLVPSPAGKLNPSTKIDISHESLLRQWKRLQKWMKSESDAVVQYRRLLDALDKVRDVITGNALALSLEWRDKIQPTVAWAMRYDGATGEESCRLNDCLNLIDTSERAEKKKARVWKRMTVSVVVGLAVTVVAMGVALFAGIDSVYTKAQNKRIDALRIGAENNLADARTELEDAKETNRIADENLEKANQKVIETTDILNESQKKQAALDVQLANATAEKVELLKKLDELGADISFADTAKEAALEKAREADKELQVAQVRADNATQLAEAAIKTERDSMLARAQKQQELITALEFSQKGSDAIQNNDDISGGILWFLAALEDLPDNEEIGRKSFKSLIGGWYRSLPLRSTILREKGVYLSDFSPDGNFFVSVNRPNVARVWNLKSGIPRDINFEEDEQITAVVFNGDSKKLAIGTKINGARPDSAGNPTPPEEKELDANLNFDRSGSARETEEAEIDDIVAADAKENPDSGKGARVDGKNDLGRKINESAIAKRARVNKEAIPNGRAVEGQSETEPMPINHPQPGDIRGPKVRIWERSASNWTKRSLTIEPKSEATSISFNPDGQTITVASKNAVAHFEIVKSGGLVGREFRHRDVVLAMAYDNNGQRFAGAGLDGRVQLWDVDLETEITFLDQYGGKNPTLERDARTSDREQMDTIARDKGSVKIVAFNPANEQLATVGDDNVVLLWQDPANENLIPKAIQTGDLVTALAYNPNGKNIAIAEGNGIARLWNTTRPKPLNVPPFRGGGISQLSFLPDGKTLATWGVENGAVNFWPAARQLRLNTPLSTDGSARALAFSPDGQHFASASFTSKKKVLLREVGHINTPRFELEHDNDVRALSFGLGGKLLVTAVAGDSEIHFWDVLTGTKLSTARDHGAPVSAIAFERKGPKFLTMGENGSVRLWNSVDESVAISIDHGAAVTAIAISSNGNHFVTVGKDNRVRRWTGGGIPTGDPFVHTAAATAVAMNTDGTEIAIGDENGTIEIWNDMEDFPEEPLQLGDRVSALSYGDGGHTLVAGSDRGIVQLWDTVTKLRIGDPIDVDRSVKGLSFSTDGTVLGVALFKAAEFIEMPSRLEGNRKHIQWAVEVRSGLTLEKRQIRQLDRESWLKKKKTLDEVIRKRGDPLSHQKTGLAKAWSDKR